MKKNFLFTASGILASLVLSQAASANSGYEFSCANSAQKTSFVLTVDEYWQTAYVSYVTPERTLWAYTAPCYALDGDGYECVAQTAWGTSVVYTYYPTDSNLVVWDTVYTCS